jgi:hypothetical protein
MLTSSLTLLLETEVIPIDWLASGFGTTRTSAAVLAAARDRG